MTTQTQADPAHELLESIGLKLSPEFCKVVDAYDYDEKLVTGGVRSGKSTSAAAEIFTDYRFWQGMVPGPQGRLVPFLAWIVGGTYLAAQKEMSYLVEWAVRTDTRKTTHLPSDGVQRLVLKNGAIVETRSASIPERLASEAPHKILVVEAGAVGPLVRNQLLGRALENNAQIEWSGTLEDTEGKPRFAWYEEAAIHWQSHKPGVYCDQCDSDGGRKIAMSLPSWSNIAVFPGGEDDPKIQRQKRELDPYTFDRMVRGVPSGIPHPAYPQLSHPESRLMPIPPGTTWLRSAGGADYGSVHPSALVVVSLADTTVSTASELSGAEQHIAWVREVWWDGDGSKSDLIGDTARLNANKFKLSRKYRCYRWRVDPNERYMAGQTFSEAVSLGAGSRDFRIGAVKSRLNNWTLYYDIDGPGVQALYEEQKRVHYRVNSAGQLILVREQDDRTAALENAIDALDGEWKQDWSRPLKTAGKTDWGRRSVT